MNIFVYVGAFFAVCGYAALAPISKKFLPDVPPFAFISLSTLFLAIAAGTTSFFYERGFSLSKMSSVSWAGVLVYSLINFVAYFLYLHTIIKAPVVHYQMMALMTPIIGGIFAYLLLGEPFKYQYLIGLIVVSIGVFIAIWDWR